MGKNIDKKLRDAAAKEHNEILDANRPFLEDVLLPMVKDKQATVAKKRRPKALLYGLLTVPAVVIMIVAAVLIFPLQEDNYLGPYTTTPSNIEAVNGKLHKTVLHGELSTVILSAHPKTAKPMFFSISHEIVKDDGLIESTVELILERSLSFDFEKDGYKAQFDFLGYAVKINETVSQSTYDGLPVSEFTVKAYFDTGKERFYISYYEMSAGENSSFEGYLAALIRPKN